MRAFINRTEAGELLAKPLLPYKGRTDVIVLALPRGGVPIGYQVAKALHVPLDVFLVRKLGVPGQEELAMGAIASGDITVFNEDIVSAIGIPISSIEAVITREKQVLAQREKLYRGDRPKLAVNDKIVILTDDGIATGASMSVAIKALKALPCKKIVVAVPVIPVDTCAKLQAEVDELVYLETPSPFYAIGNYYQDFTQTSDDEVIELLELAKKL